VGEFWILVASTPRAQEEAHVVNVQRVAPGAHGHGVSGSSTYATVHEAARQQGTTQAAVCVRGRRRPTGKGARSVGFRGVEWASSAVTGW
jgi:L-amino acid N-acyltransferase YncA